MDSTTVNENVSMTVYTPVRVTYKIIVLDKLDNNSTN